MSLIKAIKSKKRSLGEVGQITKINKSKLSKALKSQQIPIISPIGWSANKSPLNINADDVACFIAGSIKAEKIILLTDVLGIKNESGKKISEMNFKDSKKLLKNKAIIKGNSNFEGAELMSSDLRASVALVIAASVAKGNSIINRIYHLDRGYENIEKKLKKIGVNIKRLS